MEGDSTLTPKEFIRRWMERRKVFDKAVDAIPDNISFIFSGKSETGLPFTILQFSMWETSILVLSEAKIGDVHLKALESMRLKDRDDFINNLIKEVVFSPAVHAFDPDFEKTRIPKGIQFTQEICYDELTENKLCEAMHNVIRCVAFIIWKFRNEFGELKEE